MTRRLQTVIFSIFGFVALLVATTMFGKIENVLCNGGSCSDVFEMLSLGNNQGSRETSSTSLLKFPNALKSSHLTIEGMDEVASKSSYQHTSKSAKLPYVRRIQKHILRNVQQSLITSSKSDAGDEVSSLHIANFDLIPHKFAFHIFKLHHGVQSLPLLTGSSLAAGRRAPPADPPDPAIVRQYHLRPRLPPPGRRPLRRH